MTTSLDTHATYYGTAKHHAVAFAPGIGQNGDVWNVTFVRSGYKFRAVQDYHKRSAAHGFAADINSRDYMAGAKPDEIADGNAAVTCTFVHHQHHHYHHHHPAVTEFSPYGHRSHIGG